jgi:NADH:ubiquinone oxidoreductase subunit B-like Fe-S oxidoreductase
LGLITENTPLAQLQPVKVMRNWGRRYSLWVFIFGLA